MIKAFPMKIKLEMIIKNLSTTYREGKNAGLQFYVWQ